MHPLKFDCRHRYPGGFELDASFETGVQVTALFGPSGSGKTTVLRIIAGLLTPRSGRVQLGDTTLLDHATGVRLRPERRHVGFVFQDHLLFPHLSIEANLRYGQRRRRSPVGDGVDFGRVVEVLELGGLVDRFPKSLSGGERQRVALGRALLSAPRLLLMDEPLAGLEDALKGRILTYLERAVREWRIPALYVSHVADEVQRLAERVIVLEAGRVVLEGARADLFKPQLPDPKSDGQA